MESRYEYICKLATQINKTQPINLDQIRNNSNTYNRTDIMYLVLSLLMNNGLLFQKKFSNYDWYIDKNEFSPFCMWYSITASEYNDFISLPDEEVFDQDQAELIRILKEEYEEERTIQEARALANELSEYDSYDDQEEYIEELYNNYEDDNEDALEHQHKLNILDNEVYTKSKLIPNPNVDKVTYQLKDKDGNISGKKIMWLLRNKCAHNEYSISDYHIILSLKDSRLEMIDYDLFVILNTYLEEFINVNTIKHILNQNNYYLEGETTIDDSYTLNENDIIKINEIISMFTLLLKEFFNSHLIEDAKNGEEIILNFNSYLNDITRFDNKIIPAIDNPNYKIAQISTLLTMVFVLSDWNTLDPTYLNLNFLNIHSNKSKIDNLKELISRYQTKKERLENNPSNSEKIEELKNKIIEVQKSIEYINSNENIIKHLRNSFAHGYYYFKDNTIHIYDYDNKQKQTYYATCNIEDLLNFVLSNEVLGHLYNTEELKNKKSK